MFQDRCKLQTFFLANCKKMNTIQPVIFVHTVGQPAVPSGVGVGVALPKTKLFRHYTKSWPTNIVR